MSLKKLFGLLLKAKANAAWLGAGAMVVLAFFVRLKLVIRQRDEAVTTAKVLKATVRANAHKIKVQREEELKLQETKAKILKEVKSGEDFKGVDSFTNSNDY